jgi:hypothetical protein
MRGVGMMAYNASTKEKAKELYVTSGLTVPTITSLLPEVSKYALFRWCKEGNWVKQRKERVVRTAGRRERIERALDSALDSLKDNYDPKLVRSISELAAVLKSTLTFEFTEETKQKVDNRKKGLTPEALKEIEEKLGIF